MAHSAEEVWDDLVSLVVDRSDDYANYYDYWNGSQDLPVNSSEFQSRFGTFFTNFRDNLARPIIEAAESRVRIIEFGDGEDLAADAGTIWRRNKMKSRLHEVNEEALVKGDAFVIVLPRASDANLAGIYPQVTDSCAILWSEVDPDEKVAGIKWWVDEMYPTETSENTQPFIRVNLYFDDRIERYVTTQQTDTLVEDFDKYREYDDEGAWKTTHKVGQVPMFQFSVNYDINTGRGRSDLADAAPLIDAVNKTLLDLMTASEFTAAPQRYATGVEIPIDPQTGEPKKVYNAGADQLWTSPNEGARFGQFQSGDLKAYKEAIMTLVEHLAHTSRTPVYALLREDEWPAGEAMKTAEGPLRGRVQDHQDDFGVVWADVMAAALGIEGARLEDEDVFELDPRWLPPNAPFATREHLEELKVKGEVLGVPEVMLWMEAGYDADEIALMLDLRKAEASLGLDAAADLQAQTVIDGAGPADQEVGGVNVDLLPTDESSLLPSS